MVVMVQVVMKNDGEHQFRNIQRAEYQNLFNFIQAKGLRINNLTEQQEMQGQVATPKINPACL